MRGFGGAGLRGRGHGRGDLVDALRDPPQVGHALEEADDHRDRDPEPEQQ
jgi:hypothetical protein